MKIGYLMQVGEDIRQPPFNGPANHVRQITRELAHRGHSVRVLYRLGNQIWLSDGLIDFRPVTVRRSDRGLFRLFERVVRRIQTELKLPYLGIFESLRFAMACQQELSDCDIYLERLSWMTYGGALAARWLKIPWILEYNGDPLEDLDAKGIAPAGLQRRISVGILGVTIRKADFLVATGEGWRKNCIERWGISEKRTTTIENGTDLLQILSREELKSFQPIGEDCFTLHLVYLGGFYPWHGIPILLNAITKLVKLGVDLHLVLIGAGEGLTEAQNQVSHLGMSSRVHFAGRLASEDYAQILAKADMGISPYCGWLEFSGLKIFDYKAAGLTCIASGENGQPATLQHGRTGWIVPPCDEDALIEAILSLGSNPRLRQNIGQAARLEAEEKHSWKHTADGLDQVMWQMLAKKKSPDIVEGQ